MAYSYVAKDGTGEDYTTLSEDVGKKIYFAGEVRFLLCYFTVNVVLQTIFRYCDALLNVFARSDFFPLSMSFRLKPSGTNKI